MTGKSILAGFFALGNWGNRPRSAPRSDMHTLWMQSAQLPSFVKETPAAMRTLDLLGPLAWGRFCERNLQRNWGQTTVPFAASAAAYLIKLNENLVSMGDLRRYFVEHPSFIWLCGFPRVPSAAARHGFDAEASLPTQRHLTRLLRDMPNAALQYLLADSVRLIISELRTLGVGAGDCISLDTKHIIAWVKENNPKAYVSDRYDKTKQPAGDPDCRLGCKRRHNRKGSQPGDRPPPATPTRNPVPAKGLSIGEYYWGYGSGIVVTKVPTWGEFVLAELTQPFDQSDVSYFFPLMAQVEQRLGHKPRSGTFDAGFDAWYVYDYFYRQDDSTAFAAVPFSEKGGYKAKGRLFDPAGLPLCAAGLPMPLKFIFRDRTISIIEHERGKYVCPLLYPQPTAETCPIQHKNWAKKGCTAAMPTSIGARLRYTLDLTIATARLTRISTSSAPLSNASTARPSPLASSAPTSATARPLPISTP